jgi:hypothetical protein
VSMKRALILGGSGYIEMVKHLGVALECAGYEVHHLPLGPARLTMPWPLAQRMLAAHPWDLTVGFCLYHHPDFVQEAIGSLPGVKALWNFDDPQRILTWGEALERDMQPWDWVFTSSWAPEVKQWYADRGKVAHWLPPIAPADVGTACYPGLWDALFLGTYHSLYSREESPWQPVTRLELLETLAGRGIALECLGDGWPWQVPWEDQYALYRSARVNLGHHIRLAPWLNFRDVLVTAAGGFLLSDDNPGTREHWPEEQVAYYTTAEEAADKTLYYLAHGREREQMAQAAQQTTLRLFSPQAVGERLRGLLTKE